MADILPPAPVGSPFGSYSWADWYQKVRTVINAGGTIPWASVTATPTTIDGYGITNALFIQSSAITFSDPVNDGTGAAVGTITNAPTAGNPTKWLAIDDNGTIRYIPTWT